MPVGRKSQSSAHLPRWHLRNRVALWFLVVLVCVCFRDFSPCGVPNDQKSNLPNFCPRSEQMEDGLRYFSPVRNDGNRVAGADFHHPAHLRLLGRLVTLCGPDPGRRWEPLRDDVSVRNQRRWHGLQNHPKRHPEDPLQLLLPKWVRGWERSIRGAGPS